MITRRHFTLGLGLGFAGALPLFYIGRSFADTGKEIESVISSLPQLHTIQVRRGSDIVFAAASGARSFDRAVNIKSCSKSLLGLLLGAAIDKGYISSVELPLSQVIPHLLPKDVLPEVANITLEELVSLTAPLQSTSIGNYGHWVNSPNWIEYALKRPATNHSSGEMIYSTGATHILGVAMAEATGQNLLSQARTHLGEPMGISFPAWTKDPQGYYFGGNEMSLSPRAMLDIATMIRDDGVFRGKQIISKKWLAASVIPRTYSRWTGLEYGYGWFLSKSGYMIARGYGGQVIAANKQKNIAVAITSDPTQPARSDGYFGDLMQLLEGPVLDLA